VKNVAHFELEKVRNGANLPGNIAPEAEASPQLSIWTVIRASASTIPTRGQFNATRKPDNPMPDLSDKSIDELRSKWNGLSDLDRAQEIDTIRRSGVSIRRIARGLQRSESGLRHLLSCLEASAEDQDLARHNEISISKLSRRGRAAKEKRLAPPPEIVEARRNELARKAADLISNWITTEDHNGHHGKLIIERAIREIEEGERDHSFPAIPKHAATSPELIIRRCRPEGRHESGVARINWYGQWLSRWAYFAFEDPLIRNSALKKALDQQKKR
jgi:hypothetical protein